MQPPAALGASPLSMRRTAKLLLLVVAVLAAQLVAGQSKPIPVAVKVEAEGLGKDQGMWFQAARDLTPKEATTLQSLVVEELRKQENIKIVGLDYPDNSVGIAVTAEKLTDGPRSWYIASSALIFAKKNGTDEFLAHDVFAEYDLRLLAGAIAFQFVAVRFQAATGLLGAPR